MPITFSAMSGMPTGAFTPDAGDGDRVISVNEGQYTIDINGKATTAYVGIGYYVGAPLRWPTTFPITGAFETPSNDPVGAYSYVAFNCPADLTQPCESGFDALRGTYAITQATPNEKTGSFAGTLTNVRYALSGPYPDGGFGFIPDGGCIEASMVNFNVGW
jgi:hypothetical protein